LCRVGTGHKHAFFQPSLKIADQLGDLIHVQLHWCVLAPEQHKRAVRLVEGGVGLVDAAGLFEDGRLVVVIDEGDALRPRVVVVTRMGESFQIADCRNDGRSVI
jgi:hypothetical protein